MKTASGTLEPRQVKEGVLEPLSCRQTQSTTWPNMRVPPSPHQLAFSLSRFSGRNPHTHTEWVWRCCSISSLQSSGLRPLQGYLSLTVEALPASRQVQRQVCDRVAVMKVLRPAERCISCFLHKIRMMSWPLTSWKFQEVLRSALSWAERPQHRCRNVLWAVSGPLVFILITLTFVPFTSVS